MMRGQNRYTQEELEACLKEAWTYENRDGWGKEDLDTEYIGTVKRGNYLKDIYVDTEGNYWFKERVITDHGVFTSHELTFGYPYNEWKRRKQKYKQRRRFM